MALNFGRIDRAAAFNPITAFPLDARSYFESYAAAVEAASKAEAAGSKNTVYYYGETVAVVENGVATLYTIQPDNTLAEVGGKIEIDENVFVHDEEENLSLVGFAAATAGAQLVKGADGKLSWVLPDNTTVEGLGTSVEQLRTDVDGLATRMDTAEADIDAVEGRMDTAESDIDAVEGRMTTAEGKITAAEGEITTVKGRMDTAEADIEAVEGRMTTAESDIDAVEGRMTTAEGDIDALEGRMDTAEADIEAVEGRMTTAESDIDAVEGRMDTAEADIDALETEVAKKANAADVYTIEQTDSAIATAVAAAEHLKRVEVESVEAINVEADDAEQYIYMIRKDGGEAGDYYDEYMVFNGAAERVGDWGVDLGEYAKTADVEAELDKKVDIVEGERLMTDAEGTKLEGIEAGAQVNKIESVDTAQFAIDEDKKLSLLDVAMDKVTGLGDALDTKVDKVEGERLMTDAEGTKLEGIEAGAEVNAIKTVDETQFNIDDNKNLTLLDIAMGKVTGLADALAGKVDVEEGKSLIDTTLIEKVEAIEAGAEVNVIDTVDETQFAITDRKLTLLEIAMGKVTGLAEKFETKVDKVEGQRMITADEASRLEALVLGDNGQIEISGKVNANNVEGLAGMLDLKVDKVTGKSLIDDTLIAKVEAIEAGAQVNKIESIKVAGTLLDIVEKAVEIPMATTTAAGVVKSSTGENKVAVAEDGTMEVNSIHISKIAQGADDVLILNGGASK